MKYDATASFHADYARLGERERALFREAVRRLNEAHAQRGDHWPPRWPTSLRIKPVAGAAGIWELTWSFAGPDGRATFQLVAIEGDSAIRWRRIGGHRIFDEP